MRDAPGAGPATSFVAKSYRGCPCQPLEGADFRRDTKQRSGKFGFEFRAMNRVPPGALAGVLRLM